MKKRRVNIMGIADLRTLIAHWEMTRRRCRLAGVEPPLARTGLTCPVPVAANEQQLKPRRLVRRT